MTTNTIPRPEDQPNYGGEYPRMLYKKGAPDGTHILIGMTEPLPIGGHKDIQTRIVEDADDELRAIEEGWHDRIDKALAVKKAA